MIAGRLDRCISRQRSWGVPLPFFLNKDSGDLHPRTLEILDIAADMVEAGGIEAWSKASTESILGQVDAEHYTKGSDILEVWFDSGTTHTTVLKGSHQGSGHSDGPEADLYRHDQHRGWFHSSLLTACAMVGRAPYKGILTHGFTVDAVNKEIEVLRANGQVGSSLQAVVALTVAPDDHAILASLGDDLKFFFITSAIELVAGDALSICVSSSNDTKCERCWHYSDNLGTDPHHPTLCPRCTSNLFGSGETRAFV